MTNHIQSVSAQHLPFLAATNWHCCTLDAFLVDLGSLSTWIKTQGILSFCLWYEWRYLAFCSPLVCSWTPLIWNNPLLLPNTTPPATFQWSSCLGRTPIDGAWVSANVTIATAQWCPIQLSPGNHQAIILHINLIDCIGEPWYTIAHPPGQCLNCSIPLMHKKYLNHLQNHASQHCLYSKLKALFLFVQTPTTSRSVLQLVLKSFDWIKLESMKFAEKCCCKFHMGIVQFSPELNLWLWRKHLWQLVLYRWQGHHIKAKYIKCLTLACCIPNPLGVTQASHALHDATTQYLALKPKHDFLQAEFLQTWLHDPSLSEEHHKVIAHLVSLEVLHNSYHHIRAIHQQSMGRSISLVKFFSHRHGPCYLMIWGWCCTQLHISNPLQECPQLPLSSPSPLAPLVGNFGTGPAEMVVLDGTFQCPPCIDEYTKNFIEALQFPSLEVHHSKSLLSCIQKLLFLTGSRPKNGHLPSIWVTFQPLQGSILFSGISISSWPLYTTCFYDQTVPYLVSSRSSGHPQKSW